MIIIALDIGDKRIGIAKSYPIGDMVLPLETLHRKSLAYDLDYLLKLFKTHGAELIVCGLPLNFDGTESEQTKKTLYFINKLKEKTNIPIDTADERFTTLDATAVLLEADVSRKDRKQYVDKIAASYILEEYLKIKKAKGDIK